ncbi:BrnT-like toxin [Mycobacterium phage Mask]|nr:BrnT-like toxin [Mycobacterium phage Sejanus]UVT31625.1 BrnT-like toxin [Mycobacterium phage Mask]
MRIEILPPATWHSITATEIRAVLSYPAARVILEPRRTDIATALVLHVGRPADNEPHLEVIADLIDPTVAIVFHAMMLRPAVVAEHNLERYITPDYAPPAPLHRPPPVAAAHHTDTDTDTDKDTTMTTKRRPTAADYEEMARSYADEPPRADEAIRIEPGPAALRMGRPTKDTESAGKTPALPVRLPPSIRDVMKQHVAAGTASSESELVRKALVEYLERHPVRGTG